MYHGFAGFAVLNSNLEIPSLQVSPTHPPSCCFSHLTQYADFSVRRSDCEMSRSYKYSIEGFTDSALGNEYVQCRGRCHHDEQRVGCHVDCVKTKSDGIITNILEVTASAFEPPVLAEKRRIRWFQYRLAEILQTATRRILHLPKEVHHNIAAWALDHRMTRHRLVLDFAYKRCTEATNFVSSAKISEKMYARHIEFEGVRYIASLTNTPCDNKDILLFDPTLSTAIDSLYVASDHLGVRCLLFADSSEQCTMEQEVGLWWKAVRLESLGSLIRFHGDVSTGISQ